MNATPIKALVVDDSRIVAEFLAHLLDADPAVQVVGVVPDGVEAVEAAHRLNPDVITMDIHMPGMNGFDATRRIMETRPTPIVIVSGSSTTQEQATTFHALEAGALAVVARPKGFGHPEFNESALAFVRTVKLMSEVKVVRRWAHARPSRSAPVPPSAVEGKTERPPIRVVAIGASTGGPVAIQTILAGLSKNFPIPILIVQHIAPGFVDGFVEWLSQSTGFPIQIARHGEGPKAGHVYIAPDDFHMELDSHGAIVLTKGPSENGLRPSVSCLFRSLALRVGRDVVGALLTGMGKDGAAELKLLKAAGAATIAQDESTSIVHGMPGEAIKLGAATYVTPLDRIAGVLARLATQPQPPNENHAE